MDRMLTENLSKELKEFAVDQQSWIDGAKSTQGLLENFVVKKVKEELTELSADRLAIAKQRVKLSKAIMEAKSHYNKRASNDLQLMEGFILKQLKNELAQFATDKKSLTEHKVRLNEEFASRLRKLEGFVLDQLAKEVKDFSQDKRDLVESRAKLVAESKTKLDETKKSFIQRASKLVEKTLDETLRKEMDQFRDDIKSARQNHFGRRLFEAFAAEFMTSYLSEGTKVKEFTKTVEQLQAKLDESANVISQKDRLIEQAEQRVQMADDKTRRTETLGQLLAPLTRDKRTVMEELLENVKTKNLMETFQKYLPAVLNETVSREKKTLVESSNQTSTKTTVTGDRKNRLTETIEQEQLENVSDIGRLRLLAGISN